MKYFTLIAIILLGLSSLSLVPKITSLRGSDKGNRHNLKFAEIPLKKHKVIFTSILKDGDVASDAKLVEIYDEDNKMLASTEIPLKDTDPLFSFCKGDSIIVFKLGYREKPFSRYVLIYDEFPFLKEIPIRDKWVASSQLYDNYILYSTEFTDNTIKKVDIETGSVTEYVGWYPNVEIFNSNEENVLGVFKYGSQYYKIMEDIILKSENNYYNLAKKTFSSFCIQ